MKSRGLIPTLPRDAWVVLAGDAFSSFGSGLVLPFLIVYLYRVRGFQLETAALAVGTIGIMGLVAGPTSGMLVDRLGSRRALMISLWIQALATIGIALVREPWHAFLATGLLGIGIITFWPAIQSLLSTVVLPHQRSAIFSVHYAMLNAGIGVGGVLGGFVADISNPRSFEILYTVDALSFLVMAAILMRLRNVGRARAVSTEDATPKAGYIQVLKDRVFLRVWLLMMLLTTIGYGQLQSGFPAYATGEGGVGPEVLGLAFGANTAVIVLSQLFVLRKLTGWRRTRALQLLCGLWAFSWGLTFVAGRFDGLVAAAAFIVAMGIFGLGETVLSPTIPAIVNDLAPDNLRGRYNAVYSLSWSAGTSIGPAAAGFFLGAGLAGPFFMLLVGSCGVAALFSHRMGRHLSEEANLIAPSEVEPAAAAVPAG